MRPKPPAGEKARTRSPKEMLGTARRDVAQFKRASVRAAAREVLCESGPQEGHRVDDTDTAFTTPYDYAFWYRCGKCKNFVGLFAEELEPEQKPDPYGPLPF